MSADGVLLLTRLVDEWISERSTSLLWFKKCWQSSISMRNNSNILVKSGLWITTEPMQCSDSAWCVHFILVSGCQKPIKAPRMFPVQPISDYLPRTSADPGTARVLCVWEYMCASACTCVRLGVRVRVCVYVCASGRTCARLRVRVGHRLMRDGEWRVIWALPKPQLHWSKHFEVESITFVQYSPQSVTVFFIYLFLP